MKLQLTVLDIFDVTESWKDLSACRLSDWLRPFTVMAFATTPAHCSVPCVATGRSTSATADTARRARTARHLQHSTPELFSHTMICECGASQKSRLFLLEMQSVHPQTSVQGKR